MGLCKCRTVTTLFCFEHRKNVCEKCVLADHPTCVVRTYLQWLQDSEFDATCTLCRQSFSDGRPTIRLSCFDLYHWDCLEKELENPTEGLQQSMPTTLAQAKCPICRTPVMPAGDSPLILQIRSTLSKTKWASQLPPAPQPSSAALKKSKEQRGGESPPNSAQPNGTDAGNMITIEMGMRPSFASSKRQPDETKLHAPPLGRPRRATLSDQYAGEQSAGSRLKSSLRIFLNCLMLRNVRVCSFGISPRQAIVFLLLVVAMVLICIRFVIPLLASLQ